MSNNKKIYSVEGVSFANETEKFIICLTSHLSDFTAIEEIIQINDIVFKKNIIIYFFNKIKNKIFFIWIIIDPS